MRQYLLLLLCWASLASAADIRITREGVDFFISVRTPQQTRAFYAARGLPPVAVQEIATACFLTVGLHNRRVDTLWLDLSAWRLTDAGGHAVTRISRPQWMARWNALQVPLAAQSTFGWTQLPETRDMQPDETVGGNVPIVPPAGKFTLSARLRTGVAGTGPMVEINVPDLQCPRENTPQ
jgi:hypothetical protein